MTGLDGIGVIDSGIYISTSRSCGDLVESNGYIEADVRVRAEQDVRGFRCWGDRQLLHRRP